MARLRQQLADTLAASHRDVTNLKKALTDMQTTNAASLATIYEKGDQNIELMQQLEDLARIIREKEAEIERLQSNINDLENQNRDLHNEIREVKKEAAQISQIKGQEMLLSSSMKDKLIQDPRFRRIVENKKKHEQTDAIHEIKL